MACSDQWEGGVYKSIKDPTAEQEWTSFRPADSRCWRLERKQWYQPVKGYTHTHTQIQKEHSLTEEQAACGKSHLTAGQKKRKETETAGLQSRVAPVTHHCSQYVLKEPKPHNPHSGSALRREELGGDKPHILEHKNLPPWSKQSGLFKTGSPRQPDQTDRCSELRVSSPAGMFTPDGRRALRRWKNTSERGQRRRSVRKWPTGGSGDL